MKVKGQHESPMKSFLWRTCSSLSRERKKTKSEELILAKKTLPLLHVTRKSAYSPQVNRSFVKVTTHHANQCCDRIYAVLITSTLSCFFRTTYIFFNSEFARDGCASSRDERMVKLMYIMYRDW